ncbi:MAG: hypothetical protein N2376_05415 [Clostridia bacterium]|nr:hypothetical protein [Clostridia bacterium]
MRDNNVLILGAGFVCEGKYDKIAINGTASMTGSIESESLQINGVGKANGILTTDKAEINGTLSGTDIKARKIVIRGIADFSGNIEAENFDLNGNIKCSTINAEEIDIKLKGHANVNELVGSHITVKVKEPSFTFFNVQVKPSVLVVKLIEADEIYLEHTEADVVSGSRVQIGKGCRIGRVEYRENLKIANDAIVNQIVKE